MTFCIEPKQLVPHNVGYAVDNVDITWRGENRKVFLAFLAVARLVIGVLILFFRCLLSVTIRCNRKSLDRIAFDEGWVKAASLVVRKGAMLKSSFSPLPAHVSDGPGSSVNLIFLYPFDPN